MNNDAAFQCNFLLNILFILWILSVSIKLFQLISLDFAIFTKALRTDGPTDRPTDQRPDKPSYRDAIAASKKY